MSDEFRDGVKLQNFLYNPCSMLPKIVLLQNHFVTSFGKLDALELKLSLVTFHRDGFVRLIVDHSEYIPPGPQH